MRRTLPPLMTALLLCMAAASALAARGAKNLVRNPGFEREAADWKFHDHAEGRSFLTIVSAARSGKKAARLTLKGPAKGRNGCLEQYFARKDLGGRRYRFSLWASSDAPVQYQMACVLELPAKTRHWIKPAEWREGWTHHATTFETQANTTALAVDFYIRHEGTLLIDDVSLRRYKGPLKRETAKPGAISKESGALAVPKRDREWRRSTAFFKKHPRAIDFQQRGDRLLFANRKIGLEFRQAPEGFRIRRLYSIERDRDHLVVDPLMNLPNLIQIVMDPDPTLKQKGRRGRFVLNTACARSTTFRRTRTASQETLHLLWHGVALRDDEAMMDIEVTVTLGRADPFARWRFDIKNPSERYGLWRVYFPVLNLAPIGAAKDNVFIYPQVRGKLVEDPFNKEPGYGDGVHRSGRYPAAYSMQFQALYNKKTRAGLYFGTQDPVPYLKNTEAPNTPTHITWKPGHYPPNMGHAAESFTLSFDCVVRPFTGDWWDACQIYRSWALKQTWAQKGPLATRTDIPKWYKEAPLFLCTTSRPLERTVTAARDQFMQYLKWTGMRLPCNWYAWKDQIPALTIYPHSSSNAHDGNYPKLPIPPVFAAACKELRNAGGMVCPYVCLQIYDEGPTENAPYAKEAKPHTIRNALGEIQAYGKYDPAWAMCTWPQWWRDRLKETCVTMLQRENVGGFYLDTMHGAGNPCYWTAHGHPAAGGSALPLGMHGLSKTIRDAVKALDPEAITTGEDPAENMIDVIDGKLYQRTITPRSVAPLFAAVYQDYIPRYGMSILPDSGDAPFIQAASLFVEGAQIGRIYIGLQRNVLSLDKPEHEDIRNFIGQMVAYYRHDIAKKFLCYGQLMRPIRFRFPRPMPTVSYKMDPLWEHSEERVVLPALLTGVFRSRDGELGIFIVNLAKRDIAFISEIDLSRHGLSAKTAVKVDQVARDGRSVLSSAHPVGRIRIQKTLASRHVTMFRVYPIGR